MSSCHKGKTIVVVECLRDILPESVSSTTGRDSPTAPVVGVRPEQVAHGSLVRHLLYPIERSDVIQRIDAWGETTVKTEDLVVDQSGKREVVEKICEVFPNVGIAILSKALIIEAVHLSDLTGLVVATKDRDALGVSDLESD